MACFQRCRFFVLGVAATTWFGCGGESDANNVGASAGSSAISQTTPRSGVGGGATQANGGATQTATRANGGATQTATRASAGAINPPTTGGAMQANGGAVNPPATGGAMQSNGGSTSRGTDRASGGAALPGSSLGSGGALIAVGGATVGKAGATGTGAVCCAAMPSCNAGDTQLKSKDACPANTICYSVTQCCATVWCAPAQTQCTALPVCSAGDSQVSGACPADASCYARTTCGSTITCKRAACNPEKDYNRKYLVTDAAKCAAVRITCEANAVPFSDACGCGCEQDSSCPESVNCMPGSSIVAKPIPISALCTDLGQCPFTERAF